MRDTYNIIRDMLLAADGSHMTDICKKARINQTQFKVLRATQEEICDGQTG